MATPAPLLAAVLGWASGMRSMTPPAVLAVRLRSRRPAVPLLSRRLPQPARALGAKRPASLLPLAAAGEIVGDKLPFTPARTSPPALLGRIASGALVGAALAASRREGLVLSALVGAASAAASSFVMMEARREVGERFDLPDPAVAVVEDVLAIGLSLAATRELAA